MTPTSHADCPLCRAGWRGLVLGALLGLVLVGLTPHPRRWWVAKALGRKG